MAAIPGAGDIVRFLPPLPPRLRRRLLLGPAPERGPRCAPLTREVGRAAGRRYASPLPTFVPGLAHGRIRGHAPGPNPRLVAIVDREADAAAIAATVYVGKRVV